MEAWRHPNDGGQFYASTLVDSCASISQFSGILEQAQPDIARVGGDNYMKAVAALDYLHNRCGKFTNEEYKQYSGLSLLNNKNPDKDVLMTTVNAFIASRSNLSMTARRQAIQDVLNTEDPLVMDDIGMRLSLYTDPDGSYLYLNGERYYIKDDPTIVAAYYLLPCGMGLVCDASDPTLAIACLSGVGCYESRFDRVLKEMAGGQESRNREVLSMYQTLLSAVRSKDSSRFAPVPR